MNSSNSTFYNVLSNLYWKPVSFSMQNDQIAISETPTIFNNGMTFNIIDLLKDCNDFKINNKTGMILTSLKKAQDFLVDKTTQNENKSLDIIKSPLGTLNVGTSSTVIKLTSVNNRIFNNLITSNNYKFNDEDVFNFIFDSDGYVMISNNKNYYLTSKIGEGLNNLTFEPKIYPVNQAQQFDYFLGEQTISLFQIDDANDLPRYRNIITYSPESNGLLHITAITNTLSSDIFPQNYTFDLMSFKRNIEDQKNNIKNSFLAKYSISPNYNTNDLTLDEDVKNKEYSQNYICIFPSENIKEEEGVVKFNTGIHSLKNYQTPEYKYSLGFEIIKDQPGVRRVYDKIFSGTNQLGGHKNLFLGFNSNTIEFKFKSDSITEFYFPSTADRIHIQNSGLIEDGASPGYIPYTSDKIFVKRQDYNELIPDKGQPESIKIYSNTWLCSWLSGNMDGDKVWLDRYYNSAYYTLDQALSTKAMVYNNKIIPDAEYTFDVPSEMYLEPGALYKYIRVGQKNKKTFLTYLSSNSLLQITNWNSNNLKYDYQNYYGIIYYNKDTNNKNSYINLDGSNHVLFPATTKLLEQYKLTVSIWLNVKDWSYVDGSQIFGNYYNSGFGLINESAISNPIISLIDITNNNVYNLNYKFSVLNVLDINLLYNKLQLTYINPEYQYVQRLNDFNYWIFDVKNKMGIKFDMDNQSLVKINFQEDVGSYNLTEIQEISQIEIDGNENLYLYDNINKICVVFNTFGDYLKSVNFNSTVNRIEIDLNGNIIPLYGTHSVVDGYNNIWEIVGTNLYKNKKIFANIGIVEYLTCDADNNIWILHGQDSITKIDTILNKVVDGFPMRIGKSSSLPEDPCYDYSVRRRYLNFIRIPRDSNSDLCEITTKQTEDRLVLIDKLDNELYILNQSSDIIMKLNLLALTKDAPSNILSNGDFTGYTYLRKFSTINKNITWKLKIAQPNGTNAKLLMLPTNTKNLTKGWHNFTLVFDNENGIATSYVDTIPISTETFDKNVYQIYYDYRTSLLLGAKTIKNTILNDIIDINDGYKFVGQVSEIRMYNKALNRSEIEQIYYSSDLIHQDKDLIWNMETGERSYIEEIAHWFKLQLPGSKSKYYNINIHNFTANDEVKAVIENSIRENITKISPAHTELYKINWI